MRALVFDRQPVRYAASRVASGLAGSGHGVRLGPLELAEVDPPALPSDGWVRVRPRLSGICGSDLATLDGRSSRYFEHLVSFPFVPGHEVVGDVTGGELDGRRAVVEPLLGCVARGVEVCGPCAAGDRGRCERTAFGALEPGLQIGYCSSTSGGWSSELVAHKTQLYPLQDELSDEAAVMIEPTACALHAAVSSRAAVDGGRVMVLGAGTLGLCTIAALRAQTLPGVLLAVARHPEQRRFARELGADVVVEPDEAKRAARRISSSLALAGRDGALERLTGGIDVVFDCVGSAASLAQSLAVTRPGGEIVVVGMAGATRLDLTPLWQREVTLRGSYAYGTEETGSGERRPTFEIARDLVAAAGLERLVTAAYPLDRYEEAIAHAAEAGRRGAVKIVFDLRRKR